MPPLKRRHLLRSDMASPLMKVQIDEPTFRIEDVPEPSSSDAIYSDPSPMVQHADDRGAILALRAV